MALTGALLTRAAYRLEPAHWQPLHANLGMRTMFVPVSIFALLRWFQDIALMHQLPELGINFAPFGSVLRVGAPLNS